MNKLNEYSKPIKIEKKKLTTIYHFNARDSKKGRLWIPLYNAQVNPIFKVEFAYLSKFLEKDNVSGNHYHRLKREILVPLLGEFEINLEHIDTKEKEKIFLSGDANKGILIDPGVAHQVISRGENGLFLVLASCPSTEDDEIHYEVEA